jgi:hypothetical protein
MSGQNQNDTHHQQRDQEWNQPPLLIMADEVPYFGYNPIPI